MRRLGVSRHARVVVKPNLCTFVLDKFASSNTGPELAKIVCTILQWRTRNIVIGNSDDPRQTADEALRYQAMSTWPDGSAST